ncbi:MULTISPECIES: response regulator [Calothrix]|uniref:Response regulator n=2 Tax=Calothrix TaxID=1186 RepID=A0ABR8AC62_9CYAN|nr:MULTISPECIES: response regulator [Calothrix]MBD2197314.1 response regulator [Calothrix parietina FACHB-288]MBD2225853.1 response regulator [Calothrix anomala FACHB-343]
MNYQNPQKPKVLTAISEESYRALIAFILEQQGWDVNEAKNGTEAIEKLFQEQPKLLILDDRMPQLTQGEIYLDLFAQGIKLPLVLLTSYKKLDKLALSLGIFYFLDQRFELPHSLQKIKSAYTELVDLEVGFSNLASK